MGIDYFAGAYLAGNDRQAGLVWQYQQRRGKPHEMAVSIELRRVAHELQGVQTIEKSDIFLEKCAQKAPDCRG